MARLISSLFAVRDAVRKIGKEYLLQDYTEDMVAWAKDAEEMIKADSWYKEESICLYTNGNRICLPKDFQWLECLNIDGQPVNIINKIKCPCTDRCLSICNNGWRVKVGNA
jgi:hypothetical protein